MKVGLLVIASEVLEGRTLDLNTQALAQFLRTHQGEFQTVLTVKDQEQDIQQGLKLLLASCDVLITSGGLGPTRDDLTKATLANFLGRRMAYSAVAEEVARANYTRFGRSYPGKEHGYSFLPEGFIPLANPSGFAPGLFTRHQEKFLLSAPGVPREFKSMLNEHLPSLVLSHFESTTFKKTITIRTAKIPEEKIFGELDPGLWDKLECLGEVSSLPETLGVDVCVKIRAPKVEELVKKEEQVLQIIDGSPLKNYVWNYGPESLEEIIVKKANARGITFGFAESCTGGLCSHRITNVSGSSQTFLGSVISYSSEVKAQALGVETKTLEQFGAVSLETAREMAQGLAEKLKVNIGISITGLAGPNGGTPEKPVGTFCVGVSRGEKTEAFQYQYRGEREQLKNRFAQMALLTLLQTLEEFA